MGLDRELSGWCVVKSRPNKELMAKSHLIDQGHNVFLPYREITVRHSRRVSLRQKPLFPGYLFVRFDINKLRAVSSTRGVSHVITNADHTPIGVRADIMEELFVRCDSDGGLLPPSQFKVGDTIRIVNGSFNGVMAQIEQAPDETKVLVFLELMGQKVKTWIASQNLEIV